jgi:preprotein translocase subunit SecA
MDHKKEEVMQRTITDKQEQHPQSRFAQEGGELFAAMLDTIQERVTDLIFKVRIGRDDDEEGAGSGAGTGGGSKSPFDNMQLSHAEATGGGFTGVNADREAAMKAQGDGRKVTETIRRDEPKVGRNDPCPCGSGKKYKQCHGKKGG